jgi:hypothetical protein
MTQRNFRKNDSTRRAARAMAAFGALIAAGCATTPFKPSFSSTGTYVFTVSFANGCPASVEVDVKNCDASAPRDCVRVRNGEAVEFVAAPATTPPARFTLQFAPFKAANVDSNGGRVALRMEAPPNPDKRYPFSVMSGSCAPLDPWIIVQ